MTNISKTIVFFGTDNFSLVTLEKLINLNYDIAAVVTKPDNKSGRGHKIKQPEVKILAQKHNIAVWQPNKVSEINDLITKLNKDVIGVLVSYGKIIPQSIIDLFNPGIINIHPSLLPLYRGSTPIESAIYNNDKKTGVTIMQLTSEMDAGPIYSRIEYKLSGNETSLELYEKMAIIGADKIAEILPNIADESLQPKSQDNKKATYCDLLNKDEAWLKPNLLTAIEANCKVRSHIIFPKTKYNIFNKDIIITKAHVTKYPETAIDIKCSDGNYLSIDALIAPSGRTMTAKNFINGYSN